MATFSDIVDVAIRNRFKFHIAVILISILMVPGLIQTLTPIDVSLRHGKSGDGSGAGH